MIKILLKIIIDLVKIIYDLLVLAIHIIIKIIKISFKILFWLVKTLAKIIKRNREEMATITYLSNNEYKGEKMPYLNPEEKNKDDDKKD